MIDYQYRRIVEKIASAPRSVDTINDLLDMLFHIKDECGASPDNLEFCYSHTKHIKANWLRWALESKDTRYERCYRRALLFEAPHLVDSFFRFIEFDERPKNRFYEPRAHNLVPIIASYQDIYDGKLELLSVSQPKRTGKALANSTLVLTPDGDKPIGDMKVGDTVFGGDGLPAKVIGVYPQGKKRVFEVDVERNRFDDKVTFECCKDHLWKTISSKGEEETVSTKKLHERYVKIANGQKLERYNIKHIGAIDYPPKPVPIDPYVLGCIINFGNFWLGPITTTIPDDWPVKRMNRGKKKKNGLPFATIAERSRLKSICMINGRPEIKQALVELGLSRKGVEDRFVPDIYKYNSPEVRRRFLEGVSDAGGECDPENPSLQLPICSKQLAKDIEWMAVSLGYRARIKTFEYGDKAASYAPPIELSAPVFQKVYIFSQLQLDPLTTSPRLIKRLYKKRKPHLYCNSIKDVRETDRFEEMTCIEVDSKDHTFVLSDGLIKTHNTTSAMMFVAMLSGRDPDKAALCAGRGSTLASQFYTGILSIFNNSNFIEVFPRAKLFDTKADIHNIELEKQHAFATVQCRSIDGAIVGTTEATNILYVDDAVEGREEAKNKARLEKLNEIIQSDVLGRRIEGTPILVQGTRYSLYDPIGMLLEKAEMLGWKYRELAIPALDPVTDQSNFECVIEGKKRFTTEFYQNERRLVPDEVWGAEFQQEPFEAKGRLFPKDDLNYYFDLPPDKEPDAIIAACDTAESGDDSTSMPVGYIYGNEVYVEDVVFDSDESSVTKPECANCLIRNKVSKAQFESNSAGAYFARDVDGLVQKQGGSCSVTTKRSVSNKMTRMEMASDVIKKHFYFKDQSTYQEGSQYDLFMKEVTTLTRSGKNRHDDAPDSLAMLENFLREEITPQVVIVDRRRLGIL